MSDTREERALSVSVPADLEEWLDERAGRLDVDREELLVELLSAFRAAEAQDGEVEVPPEAAVDDSLEAAIDERLEAATESLEAAIDERIEDRLDERLDALESDVQEKIVDVRERVIQVKKEADAKADADHTHDELEEVPTLSTVVEALEDSVDDLEQRHQAAVADLREELSALAADLEDLEADVHERLDDAADERADLDERLADASDKLRRVAWVVSDLKDEVGADDAHQQAVARIKRAAAQEGVRSATCENCGESVDVALLTAPECPHCEATVSDVRPSGGILRKKARLVAAAQLESGEEGEHS